MDRYIIIRNFHFEGNNALIVAKRSQAYIRIREKQK